MGFYCIYGAACFQEILIMRHLFPAHSCFSNVSSSIGKENKKPWRKSFYPCCILVWHECGEDQFWRPKNVCFQADELTLPIISENIFGVYFSGDCQCMSRKELCNSMPRWKQFSSNLTQVSDKLRVDLFYFVLDLFFIREHCALVCMPGTEE